MKKARKILAKRKAKFPHRKQTILLITFGMDQTKAYMRKNNIKRLQLATDLGQSLHADGINLAIAGVGKEALAHRNELHQLVKKQEKQYFAVIGKVDILDILNLLIKFSK